MESIWGHHVEAQADVPGLGIRTIDGKNGECMLEVWEAGTSEPPHSHPGGDMTVVVEGEMEVQFFKRGEGGVLQKDGPLVVLREGQTGYVAANRIHDAKYTKACKLVYIHDGAFGFKDESK